MRIHDLIQGSPEWAAYRAGHFNASDAPAMLGVSPYKSRAQLLRELHTGVAAEIDTATHMRFANGHRAEALARPLAEEFIGAELYPVVGSDGRLSASFDGLTLDEITCFEHKALNDELRASFRAIADGADAQQALPLHHRAQMEQQLLVSGAERVLFMTSAWTPDDDLIEEMHCWYYPDATLRRQILDGWAQFERDLAAYVLPDAAPAAPVGTAPETLPALRIEVTGAVTASNLAEFKATALGAIRAVNRKLTTDQDFADAEKAVKWCAEVESRLKAAKEHALSQTADIDALFRALDDIGAEARAVRLDLDKLVTRRKTEVKEEAVVRARRALDEHVARLNAEIAPMRLPAMAADFAGCIKGLKSVASMHDKLDGLLAATKIAAEADARAIRENVATFQRDAAGFEFLFADLGQVVHKAADDFAALLQARIATHRAAEEARARARAEAEARAAEQRRQAEELAAARAESARLEAQAVENRARAAAATVAAPAPVVSPPAHSVAVSAPIAPPPAAPVPPAHADERATLALGVICGRLCFTVSAAFVTNVLRVEPCKAGASLLFTERQFEQICAQLVSHIGAIAELYSGEPA
ncbi:MAG: YqaJ viral recombinase family protein [Burkholderiales bacterium]|nr:YqaJ viral recombinase family protein [Burkholderiales bacterium]